MVQFQHQCIGPVGETRCRALPLLTSAPGRSGLGLDAVVRGSEPQGQMLWHFFTGDAAKAKLGTTV